MNKFSMAVITFFQSMLLFRAKIMCCFWGLAEEAVLAEEWDQINAELA